MAANNESCANCFYVVARTARLPVSVMQGPHRTQLTCHYDTPSGGPVTIALWPPVDPDDWCGAWSSNGLPRHRVENPTDKIDQPAVVAFAGSGDLPIDGSIP